KIESGLMKMITIGLGKQKGADAAHSYGFKFMDEHVPEMAKIVLGKALVIFGLATVENAYDRPAKIEAVPADRIFEREQELLIEAKNLMPHIKFDPIDVLVVDEIGKDISGDGLDPNISGRFPTPYATGGIQATKVAVMRLTGKSHGNANGIGLADITTKAVFDEIALHKGYANALTSTVLDTVKIPMFLDTDKFAVKAAIKTSNAIDLTKVRLVRIKNTLEIGEIKISASLLDEAEEKPDIEVVSKRFPYRFDD
ncbi:MAG TPA: hypothetical protein VFK27_02850, partial [Bacillales bacterium]|nr:hypothetical protein [Bacillales bacterium]